MEGAGGSELIVNGDRALMRQGERRRTEMRGIVAEQMRLGGLVSLLSDWREEYRELRVLWSQEFDGEHTWATVGCSPNIIEASWLALSDSLEWWLVRRSGEKTG